MPRGLRFTGRRVLVEVDGNVYRGEYSVRGGLLVVRYGRSAATAVIGAKKAMPLAKQVLADLARKDTRSQ